MSIWPRQPRPSSPPPVDPALCFTVELRGSGRAVRVDPGVSALDALLAQGVDIDYQCRSGYCGTCQTRLVEGEVEHRDIFLTEEERERFMMPCVSRAPAGGRVILDL